MERLLIIRSLALVRGLRSCRVSNPPYPHVDMMRGLSVMIAGDFVRGGAVEDIGYLLDNGVRVALYYGLPPPPGTLWPICN